MEKTKKTERIELNIFMILAMLVPVFFIRPQLDNDIWFMLSHGKYIMNEGFPVNEILTVHGEYDFNIQKWATCVMFYLLWKTFGYVGVIVSMYVLCVAIEFVMYKTLKLISNNTLVSVFTTSVAMTVLNMVYARTRPQLFSYLFILLEVYVLEKYVKTGKKRILFWIPVISLFYMQFHSTQWVMLFIIMACYVCDYKKINLPRMPHSGADKKPIIIAGIVSFGVGFINPYGYEYLVYIYKALTDGSHLANIEECQMTTITSSIIFLPLLFLLIARLWQGKHLPLRFFYLSVGTLFMGLAALRNESYTIIGLAITVAYVWRYYNIWDEKKAKRRNLFLIPVIIGCFAVIFMGLEKSVYEQSIYSDEDIISIVNVMAENVEPSKDIAVYTDFNTGGYVEWKGYTGYIDARSEVFCESINGCENTFEEASKFAAGDISFDEMQEMYGFKYYLVEKNSAEAHILLSEGCKLMTYNDTYAIFNTEKK